MSQGAPVDEVPNDDSMSITVRQQLDGNEYRVMLLKALGAGLIALISLSQLGTGARFGSGGPRGILASSVSAVVIAAVFFGLAYGNFSYTSAQLKARLARPTEDTKHVSESDMVPKDVLTRVDKASWQMTAGVLMALIAVGLYMSSVWWPT